MTATESKSMQNGEAQSERRAELLFSGDRATLVLAGPWKGHGSPLRPGDLLRFLGGEVRVLQVEDQGLGDWDTSLLTFLDQVRRGCLERGIGFDPGNLPGGIRRLLALAAVRTGSAGHPDQLRTPGWLARIGNGAIERWNWFLEFLELTGQLCLSLPRLVTGRARLRGRDLGYFLQDCGAGALPIVSLISLLVGLILAFVGAVQLQMFGAQIYVANLVGIGMARDMGPMMTAVIMAGRTGAAYAAQIGSMQANEEVDALRTLGLSPVEFLVLPRTLALVLMMPLLACYADLMGILGGGLACISLFDISPLQYLQQTRHAVPIHHFAGGLAKATVYGAVVAIAGCHRGLACGRSAQDVGRATTAAVVTGIVWVVVWCAILTVVFNAIGL